MPMQRADGTFMEPVCLVMEVTAMDSPHVGNKIPRAVFLSKRECVEWLETVSHPERYYCEEIPHLGELTGAIALWEDRKKKEEEDQDGR